MFIMSAAAAHLKIHKKFCKNANQEVSMNKCIYVKTIKLLAEFQL